MKEKNRIFAEALNKLMYEHHLSQNDLAAKIGMTKSAVSYWCRGERYPNEDGLNKLCKLFRCLIIKEKCLFLGIFLYFIVLQ